MHVLVLTPCVRNQRVSRMSYGWQLTHGMYCDLCSICVGCSLSLSLSTCRVYDVNICMHSMHVIMYMAVGLTWLDLACPILWFECLYIITVCVYIYIYVLHYM